MLFRSSLALLTLGLGQAALSNGYYHFDGNVIKLQSRDNRTPEPLWQGIVLEAQLPEQVDLRENQSPVKNQSNRGSCAYFAATGLVEQAVGQHTGTYPNISEEFLIYANKTLDRSSSRGDGSFTRSNLISLRRHGILPESVMPYNRSWFEKGLPCGDFEDGKPETPSYCYAHFAPVS